jgi:Cyclic nucleotide-binding domain/Major Facilitator Superfamily
MGTTAAAGGRRRRLRAFGSLTGNRALLRVLAAYLMFTLTEYAVWIAMLVFAYNRGGTAVAGLVAVAQLVPAAVAAPVVASVADRRSPVVLLAGGYLAQATAMAGTAVAVSAGAPLAAYAGAVVAATAVTTTRPAQSALIPSLAATPDQLTAANVVAGWMEAAGIAAAGLLAGVLISLAGVGSVFAVCAGLGLLAALLVAGRGWARRVARPAAEQDADGPVKASAAAGIGEGLRLAVGQPRLRLMLALLTADAVVTGALDLLVVILALTVLGRSPGWVGYLQFAFGAGALLAATVSAVLVGRRLSGPILAAALAFSVALAVVAFGLGLAGTVALLAVAGAGHSLLAVATRTLLQRSVPPQLIGRIFGVLEGLMMAGFALGALLVPALAHLGGSRLAVLGVAAVLPLAAVAGGRAVFRLDAGTAVPVVEIALLRSLPLFAELPAPAIEGLAAALRPVQLSAGAVLIRQGDPGDAYFAIAAGELDAEQDGQFLGRYGRGDGVGEIALLRAVPRTATVTAHTAATVYRLDRDLFLTAVLGHAPTRRQADRIAATRLAAKAAPAHCDSPQAG